MKVIEYLCFLCMAVSVSTEKPENVSTTSKEQNATGTSETSVFKDADIRRFWPNVEGSNPFEIDPGINPNQFIPLNKGTSEKQKDLKSQQRSDFAFNQFSKPGQNEYPSADSGQLFSGSDSYGVKEIASPYGHDFSLLMDSLPSKKIPSLSVYNPYHKETEFPVYNIPQLEVYKPDEGYIPYHTPHLIYSTTMPPIIGLTPCENSNVLQNVINNLLGLLLAKIDISPKLKDINFAIDSINSHIDTNPKGLFDPQFYPTLKYYEQKTAPGGISFSSRLKRDLKTKIVFKQEIPRINEPECKEAFLKLMALSYRAYIEASKLPDCKIKNHVIPDNPYNPTKIIIPTFENSNENNQWNGHLPNTNVKDKPFWSQELDLQNLKPNKYNISQYSLPTQGGRLNNRLKLLNSTIDDEFINDLINSLPSLIQKTDTPDFHSQAEISEYTLKAIKQLEKELAALLSKSGLEVSKDKLRSYQPFLKNTEQNPSNNLDKKSANEVLENITNYLVTNANNNVPQNSFHIYSFSTPKQKEILRTMPETDIHFTRYIPPKESIISPAKELEFNNVPWIKSVSDINKADPIETDSNSPQVLSLNQDLLTRPLIIPNKQEPQLHIFVTNNGPIDNVPTSPWSRMLLSPVESTVEPTVLPWALRNGPSFLTSNNQRFLPQQPDQQNSPWLPLNHSPDKAKSQENSSNTEKPQIRNNRSIDLRNALLEANLIRNNILANALRSQTLSRLFPQNVNTLSLSQSPIVNPNTNQVPLGNLQLRTLNPTKLLLLKKLLAQYRTTQNFKNLGGNLGMVAFWLANPKKNTLTNPEITQKNVINVYLQTQSHGFDPQQKEFLIQMLGDSGLLTDKDEISKQNNELLKVILWYLKQLLLNTSADKGVNPVVLNKLYEIVSKLSVNAQKKQNIIVLLRVYVNWATQHGFDGNINDMLDHIKKVLQNEIESQPSDNKIPFEIIENINEIITKIVLDPEKQKIVAEQMKLYIKWVVEHNVDLSKPENMNQLQAYLKDAIIRVLDINEYDEHSNENSSNIDPSVLVNIKNLIDSYSLTIEQKEFVLIQIRAYITAAKATGVDFSKFENLEKLIYFIRSILEKISAETQGWEIIPITTQTPDNVIPIPTRNPYDDWNPNYIPTNDDTAVPVTDFISPVNPSILTYINKLIESLIENPEQREFIITKIHTYIYQAHKAGVDFNDPQNLKQLILFTKTIIVKVLEINSNQQLDATFVPPSTEDPSSAIPINPAILDYLHKLVASLVPNEEQRQIVIVRMHSYIKYFIGKGIDLNVKTNLNKLIWIIVNIIKTVVNNKPVFGEKPSFSHNLQPDTVEIIYKLEQQLLIQGFATDEDELSTSRLPNSYVKYRVPYNTFTGNLKDLMLRKPALRTNPDELSRELELRSNITEVSPELQGLPKSRIIKLIAHNGSFVDAKIPLDDRKSLRSAADLETSAAFERTVHDLDLIINNVTETNSTTLEELDDGGDTYSKENVTDSSGFDPLGYNEANPFYHLIDHNKNSTPVEVNSIANLLSDEFSSTNAKLPFKL